ncbi:glutaredoxin family protein [uncultured Nevskia sp.]|uniref:glutaredoxin family protein n=1 Tax=uncultured Nevskia sp. TaxID=228950 RepID=UPI0025EDA65E|nr:glutaredoxin family protein [uncultured Nevskia sp.]
MTLTLLSRDGCGLCEEFADAFAAAFPAQREQLLIADVDSRPGWQGRYGLIIPVLLDDEGTVICETHFDETAVGAWLAAALKRAPA